MIHISPFYIYVKSRLELETARIVVTWFRTQIIGPFTIYQYTYIYLLIWNFNITGPLQYYLLYNFGT